MFSNMMIRSKILAAFFVITLMTLFLGIFSLTKIGKVNTEAENLANNLIPAIIDMSIVDSQLNLNRRGEIQACTKTTPEEFARYSKRQTETMEKVNKAIDGFEKLQINDSEKKSLTAFKAQITEYYKDSAKTFEIARTGDVDETIKAMRTVSKKSYDTAQKSAAEFIEINNKKAISANAQSKSVFTSARYWIIGTIVVCMALAMFLGLLIASVISKPVRKLLEEVNTVASGDLRVRLSQHGGDEIGQLATAFSRMTDNLCTIINQISSTSTQVADASRQLHSESKRIATGTDEVATQTFAVATAGEEMSATSGTIAQNCQMVADGAHRASKTASDGAAVVERTVTVMGQIAEKVKESAKTVENLGARSDQIGNIIGTIEDIADQTNLLALNAAIEAARAGEQGRGFAVVADEVRALAERTTRATKEIGGMIKAIQNETKDAVTSMEKGVLQVKTGTEEAAKSGRALQEILEQINDVSMQINQIATAAEEQTSTTGEISNNMQHITDVLKQTSHGARESAIVAAQLNENAEELQRVVRQFMV